jgi:hypothetical protein
MDSQERRVIIITTVRSSRDYINYDLRYTLGFVANPRRFNGALRRLLLSQKSYIMISHTHICVRSCSVCFYSRGHSCESTSYHSRGSFGPRPGSPVARVSQHRVCCRRMARVTDTLGSCRTRESGWWIRRRYAPSRPRHGGRFGRPAP